LFHPFLHRSAFAHVLLSLMRRAQLKQRLSPIDMRRTYLRFGLISLP
jgi:hypothetical protein